MVRTAALVGVVICLDLGSAWGQSPQDRVPGRIEIGVGAAWTGGASFGTRDATLTASDGTRFRLFSTSTDLGSASGLEARVGVRLVRALQVEGVASYGTPMLITSISADAETGRPGTASEAIKELTIEAGIVAHLTFVHIGAHVMPILTTGGGYLRQLHEGQTLVQTGRAYHVGGGVKYLMRSRDDSVLKSAGLRVEMRATVRSQGAAFDERAHVSPGVAASLFVGF